MNASALRFELPPYLEAAVPPEARGLPRDGVRLLVLRRATGEVEHATFRDLPRFLRPGDLLVVNRSRTLPASLPALWRDRPLRIHLSTELGGGCWIIEPRAADGSPWGDEPLTAGAVLRIPGTGTAVRVHDRYRGFARLYLASAAGDLRAAAETAGEPIRYGYVRGRWPLAYYQTMFAAEPGSAEMPSAGRPFTPRLVRALRARGVGLAGIVLHTGVSSHEITSARVEEHPVYPEWYTVPPRTAGAVNATRRRGGRVIAVGTTVVRALETVANQQGQVRPGSGWTELFIKPGDRLRAVDGLITGLHPPLTSHLALLGALVPPELLLGAYAEAVRRGYLWHEFGDANLIL
ncbi:MAG TPA: S-adenosylmethionine:tRNA ribosyltransferase-isomerase [Thermaerobacter sp.]